MLTLLWLKVGEPSMFLIWNVYYLQHNFSKMYSVVGCRNKSISTRKKYAYKDLVLVDNSYLNGAVWVGAGHVSVQIRDLKLKRFIARAGRGRKYDQIYEAMSQSQLAFISKIFSCSFNLRPLSGPSGWDSRRSSCWDCGWDLCNMLERLNIIALLAKVMRIEGSRLRLSSLSPLEELLLSLMFCDLSDWNSHLMIWVVSKQVVF